MLREEAFSERIRRIQAAAAGRWMDILISAGVPEALLRKKGRPCPLCGGTDRFAFYQEKPNGYWFCRGCGYGDGLKLLQLWRRETFRDTLTYMERFLGLSPILVETAPVVVSEKDSRIARLEALWAAAVPVKDTPPSDPVRLYLRSRGLPQQSEELRSHPLLDYWEAGDEGEAVHERWPAMLARVTDDDGNLLSLHRTYLTPDGRKAPVEVPKKLVAGPVTGGLIRLMPVTDVLGIAEGVETALAAQVMRHMPVWSAISVGGFEKIRCLPATLKRLVIYGDNDESFVGQAGAWALASRLRRELPDLDIQVEIPETSGYDWNDVWLARRSGTRKPSAK